MDIDRRDMAVQITEAMGNRFVEINISRGCKKQRMRKSKSRKPLKKWQKRINSGRSCETADADRAETVKKQQMQIKKER